MTRINTNVSSLNAQKTLARSNTALQQALTRLSTGLRINVGKDDPAGLIASEALRSDITAVTRAISNSQRANQMIATADSALGQAASLLNDIRGLVTEAANEGAMSDEQIAANQLQIDSSLEALNRIAQTTTFQGRKLLDGSLDFVTSASNNFDDIVDLDIDQANLGATGSIDVEINIAAAATKAQITSPELQSQALLEFDGANNDIILTAATAGEDFDGVIIDIAHAANDPLLDPPATALYDAGTKTLTVTLNTNHANYVAGAVDPADIIAAIDGDGTFDADNAPGNDGSGTIATSLLADGSTVGTANTIQDIVVQISGSLGSEVFSFQAGATVDQIVAAVNLVSDATGVEATNNAGILELDSTEYGSDEFVAVEVLSEDDLGTFEDSLSATRATGTDIDATVNGVGATGEGNTLSINTSTLDLRATIAAGETDSIEFTISDGGALFQLGPDVVSNQQARLGIGSLNAASLGGASGRLYQLASGGEAALASDTTLAATIVDEALNEVTSLRGRLGAFQRTTLDTNIASLSDTLENLSEAESSIRDADFAVETAALTRAQILVQSGLSVLTIANSNPQNVLALLR